ncbi:MAG: c-type cytochrome [Myxococcota bacterium]|nr:c-type cytochrome [Myxococcota bacterium]
MRTDGGVRDATFDAWTFDVGVDASGDAGGVGDAGSRDANATGFDAGPVDESERRPGGDTTTSVLGVGAFVQPAANLSLLRLQFFQLDWVPAPGSPPESDGLGPTFNAASCLSCHARNGRAVPGDAPNAGVGVLVRLGTLDHFPDPRYGDQLQPFGVAGVPGEARVEYAWEIVREVVLPGGQRVVLRRPTYTLRSPAHGPLAEGVGLSPRTSPHLLGQGLLEAVPESVLAEWHDPDDRDGDGVSGRLPRLPDGSVGRFGWKSAQPTVEAQTAAAFLGDLGLTSPMFPTENCPEAQAACRAAPSGGSPELPAVRLRVTSSYVRLLGVPTRRDPDAPQVLAGRALFRAIGCASCHRPNLETGDAVEPELAHQTIWPYTDLLLHDLGEGLADGVAEGDAAPSEWRTPPLWGLGLVPEVNGALALLHDGRAHTWEEAILWHDGEAEAARATYETLSAGDRAAIAAFLASL